MYTNIIAHMVSILIEIYSTGRSAEAEGTIVARVVPSFDHRHSWLSVFLVAAAVLIVTFAVLWLLLKSKHKKGTELHDMIIICLTLQKCTSVYV